MSNRSDRHGPESADDAAAVEAAHRAYYTAWEVADVDTLVDAWLDSEGVCCAYPGVTPVHGRRAVFAQIAEGVDLTPGIQFLFEDVVVVVRGNVARLSCVETVVSGAFDLSDLDLQTSRLATTTTFVGTADGWKIWTYHAGPVLSDVHLED